MSTTDESLIPLALTRIAGVLVQNAAGTKKFPADIAARVGMVEVERKFIIQLYTMTDLEVSEGVQLDVIGRVIGQSRRIERGTAKWFFGFDDSGLETYPFAEEDLPYTGGPWFNEGDSTADSALLDDAAYKRALMMRLIYNNAKATTKSWLELLYDGLRLIFYDWDYLFNNYGLALYDEGGMHIRLEIGKTPTSLEKALVKYANILPINSGVSFTVLYGGDLGFDDTPGVTYGFDEEGAPGSGGTWAEEL